MEKLTLYIGIIVLLASCNSNDDNYDLSRNSREIKLNTSIQTTNINRAIISNSISKDLPIGIYAYNHSWKAGSSTNLINNDNATLSISKGNTIKFGNGRYYYPVDGSTVNFYAFTPRGTESLAAGVGTSPIVNFSMTGQEDIMWASSTGYKIGSNAAVHPVLNFSHQLTQLQFKFIAGANYPTNNKVVSLTVNSQPTNACMTVGTGVCIFSGSADMQALSSANRIKGIGIKATPGTNANSPVMTNVASGTSAYLLTIVVSQGNGQPNVTYTNVPVNITTVAGNAYMLTLKFSSTAVTVSATASDWVNKAKS